MFTCVITLYPCMYLCNFYCLYLHSSSLSLRYIYVFTDLFCRLLPFKPSYFKCLSITTILLRYNHPIQFSRKSAIKIFNLLMKNINLDYPLNMQVLYYLFLSTTMFNETDQDHQNRLSRRLLGCRKCSGNM